MKCPRRTSLRLRRRRILSLRPLLWILAGCFKDREKRVSSTTASAHPAKVAGSRYKRISWNVHHDHLERLAVHGVGADRQTEDLGLLLALFARSPAAILTYGIAQMSADKTKMTHLHLGFDAVELHGRSRRGVAIRD